MRFRCALIPCLLCLLCPLIVNLAACGDDDDTPNDAGMTVCDELRDPLAQPGDPIDGDNFDNTARPFFETYCTRCHASHLTTPDERNDAPEGFDWDRADAVRAALPEIRNAVGVTNFMPFNAPFPTCAERARIVRWIDADAP